MSNAEKSLNERKNMFQILLTPSAGKRLIAKATVECLSRNNDINKKTIVIIAGTTNGYVAEELLAIIGQLEAFNRKRFFRGVTTPPAVKTTDTGRLPDESQFAGDVVIVNGSWERGKTIFDVVDSLKEGDVIIKGANSVDPDRKKAGILIGHPKGGTIIAALQTVIGKRVALVIPVGLEKRIADDIDDVARTLNRPGSAGFRLMPVSGEIITEIEAIKILFGLDARLIAAGGIGGAEGSVWLCVEGAKEKEEQARAFLGKVAGEPPFTL
jgi:hypothetical protein